MKLFGVGASDHPMADVKEARAILDAIPAGDPFKVLEDLSHWLESVRTWPGFKPEHRAQIVQMVDDAAQLHLRKLQREYVSSQRPSKFLENRLWSVIREWHRQSGLAFAICIDAYATGQKGWEDLKQSVPLLTVRALRALAAQMKWQHMRYGPAENSLWEMIAKIYALSENRKYSQSKAIAYPGSPAETSPEQEFLKAVMFAASSPDSLLPVEIELVERLIAHLAGSFKLTTSPRPDIVYCFDLANHEPPVRAAHLPHRAPTLRFFAAGGAVKEIEKLAQTVKSTGAVPSSIALGGNYEPEVVLDVLDHLALHWAPKPPERRAQRHRVKSRLTVTYGFDGVRAALDPTGEVQFDPGKVESWIVELLARAAARRRLELAGRRDSPFDARIPAAGNGGNPDLGPGRAARAGEAAERADGNQPGLGNCDPAQSGRFRSRGAAAAARQCPACRPESGARAKREGLPAAAYGGYGTRRRLRAGALSPDDPRYRRVGPSVRSRGRAPFPARR